MKLHNRINRRLKIYRASRELSRLSDATLTDLGFDRRSIRRTVEDMIDTVQEARA